MPTRRAFAALAAALVAAACSTFEKATIPPSRASFAPSTREQAFKEAVRVLEERGFAIASADPAGGVITTKTTDRPGEVPCGATSCPYRDTVEVVVGADGGATVTIHRELFFKGSLGRSRWGPPARSHEDTVARIVAEQDAILLAMIHR